MARQQRLFPQGKYILRPSRKAQDGLSDKERALMNMLLDGFSVEDICQTLGYKETSVLKNVKCRALRKMKSAAAQKRYSYTA